MCMCFRDGESLMEILQRLQTASVVSHIFLILLRFYCSHKFRFSVCEYCEKNTHIKHAINKMVCMRACKCSWVRISHPLQRYCLMVICAPEFHRNCIWFFLIQFNFHFFLFFRYALHFKRPPSLSPSPVPSELLCISYRSNCVCARGFLHQPNCFACSESTCKPLAGIALVFSFVRLSKRS